MGIDKLWSTLQPIRKVRSLWDFAGQIIGIDGHGLLHRGSRNAASRLALGKLDVDYINYMMRKMNLLKRHGIQPYMVFDGCFPPCKNNAGLYKRQQRKASCLRRALGLVAKGSPNEARPLFANAVRVTPQMVFQAIKALRAAEIPYIVAPYEAESQLAHLARSGIIDAVLSDDSDCLIFGCSTLLSQQIINGTVISTSRSDIFSLSTFAGLDEEGFRRAAIMSGCDYLPKLPGLGYPGAFESMKKTGSLEKVLDTWAAEIANPLRSWNGGINAAFDLWLQKLEPQVWDEQEDSSDMTLDYLQIRKVTQEQTAAQQRGQSETALIADFRAEYMKRFLLAEKCFLHQRVYDPDQKQVIHLTELDPETWDTETDEYVGKALPADMSEGIVLGDIDPSTFTLIKDEMPGYKGKRHDVRKASLRVHKWSPHETAPS